MSPTPGVATSQLGDREDLPEEEKTRYRSAAARIKYLASDRPDIQFAAKEICRAMSTPQKEDWLKVKKVGRYLQGKPRSVHLFKWQDRPEHIDVYCDSDWAGENVTGKSTSGGMIFWGEHLIKSWSSTQKNISLSSGEAELMALNKEVRS